MATPTRSRRRLELAGSVYELEVVTSTPSGTGPAVLLAGALGSASGARATRRLARAGFTVIACEAVEPAVASALADCLGRGGVAGVRPTSVGTATLSLDTASGNEDAAIGALVRDLTSRLT